MHILKRLEIDLQGSIYGSFDYQSNALTVPPLEHRIAVYVLYMHNILPIHRPDPVPAQISSAYVKWHDLHDAIA